MNKNKLSGALTLEQARELMDTSGDWLDLRGTRVTTLPDNLTVGGWLDLEGAPITTLPDNLTVGGSLNLSGTQITTLPDNLTVGGWLDLRGTRITSLPDNLTVGGCLDLSNTQITNPNNYRRLQDGDYVPGRYLYADGILTHVKGCKQVQGYTYYIGKIKDHNVVSDGTYYAHCETLRDGLADLIFKAAQDRGADQYKDLTLDSLVQAEDAITMYRIITGACRAGTQRFVESLGTLKEAYTVREIMDMTQGRYGVERFREFFAS